MQIFSRGVPCFTGCETLVCVGITIRYQIPLMMLLTALFALQLTATEVANTAEAALQSAQAPQQTTSQAPDNRAYVVDNLFIYMHAGAGENYRILGSINAGDSILLTGEQENGFSKIRDEKGRSGWVKKRFVTRTPGLNVRYRALSDEVTELQNALKTANSQIPALEDKNTELAQNMAALQSELLRANARTDTLLEEKKRTAQKEKRDLLMYGGAIGLIGVLLGAILASVLSRKSRYGYLD